MAIAAALVSLLTAGLAPATAAPPLDVETVELQPLEGSTIRFGTRTYGGTVELHALGDGLVLLEQVTLEDYLAGIAEVPFSWPEAALEAQAVAARTFLARTLSTGRSANGRKYGFDICATTQCQVYIGVGNAAKANGDRWLAAIAATREQILVYEERPALTMYSSSAGERTRAIQDIWGGTPYPYLQPVNSPEVGVTPYEHWVIKLPAEAVRRVLSRAGFDVGTEIRSVTVTGPGEGLGPERLQISTEQGVTSVQISQVRSIFNNHGTTLYPGLLPARRPSGRRWPQAVLSYTFGASLEGAGNGTVPEYIMALLPLGEVPGDGEVVFEGEGWGHAVGMSQWGAKAMADQGADAAAILSHYYTGLAPVAGGDLVPSQVAVGLDWRAPEVRLTTRGSIQLVVNQVPVGVVVGGEWLFRSTGSGIAILPPAELDALGRRLAIRRWPR